MRLRGRNYEWVLIIGIGFVLRLAHLFQWRKSPFFEYPAVDELYHYLWAKDIANGNILGDGPFFRAPFYPYFLSATFKIFKNPFFYPRLIQMMLGVVALYLVWRLALQITKSRIKSLVVGLVCAIYPAFIYFEARFLLDWLLVFLDTLILILLVRSDRKNNLFWLFLSGVVGGLSAITRPNILPVLLLLFLWWVFAGDAERRKKWLKGAVLFFIGVLIPIIPVSAHNIIYGKDFVLIASQGGINFYIGNNAASDGASSYVPELGTDWQYIQCRYLAEEETGKKLKPSEVSRFYYKKGLNFILNEPISALKLYLRKIYLLLNKFEISDNQNMGFHKRYSWVLRIPIGFWLIAPLGFASLVFVKDKNQILLAIFVVAYSLTLIPFFITARLRLPIVVPLVILGVDFLFATLKSASNQFMEFLKRYIAILAMIVISWTNWAHIPSNYFAYSYFSLGNIYLRQGRLDDALKSYESAILKDPNFKRAHLNRGVVYFRMRKLEKAEQEFLQELIVDPKSAPAFANLGVTYRLLGKREKAIEFGRKAIELNPFYIDGYYMLAQSYHGLGLEDSALSVLRLGIEKFPQNRRLYLLYGNILELKGEYAEAERAYRNAIGARGRELVSSYELGSIYEEESGIAFDENKILGIAEYNLGSLIAKLGNYDQGIDHLERAKKLYPELPDIYLQLGTAYYLKGENEKSLLSYMRAIELGKDSSALRYNIALVYIRLGNPERAREELQKSLEIDPTFNPARKALKSLK